MYIYLSAAISADGYLDDKSKKGLVLSNRKDFEYIKRLRADFDAILVGAETVRRDNPSLVIRDEHSRLRREALGLQADIIKVTVTASGNLDPESRFFTEGAGLKIVIAGPAADKSRIAELQKAATVISSPEENISPEIIVSLLSAAGIDSLFVEGGGKILTAFINSGIADHFRLAVAPFFLGNDGSVKIIGDSTLFNKNRRMNLLRAYPVDDMMVGEYLLKTSVEDYRMLEKTIELSKKCPPSETAYSVGAIIVTANNEIFTGYSRETGEKNHAEEEAIKKAAEKGAPLENATIYSSMEPCSSRTSKSRSCSRLIIDNRMRKVVFAAKEPVNFVSCVGQKILESAGLEVIYIKDMEERALRANRHLLRYL